MSCQGAWSGEIHVGKIHHPTSKNPGNEVSFYSTPFTISRRVLFQTLNIVLKVAHDWGGGVAWSFAALHPELLSNLVLPLLLKQPSRIELEILS